MFCESISTEERIELCFKKIERLDVAIRRLKRDSAMIIINEIYADVGKIPVKDNVSTKLCEIISKTRRLEDLAKEL